MICLKKASTNQYSIEKAQASCLGTSKLLLDERGLDVEEGIGDLLIAVVAVGDLLLQGSVVDRSGRSGKAKRGNKASVSI